MNIGPVLLDLMRERGEISMLQAMETTGRTRKQIYNLFVDYCKRGYVRSETRKTMCADGITRTVTWYRATGLMPETVQKRARTRVPADLALWECLGMGKLPKRVVGVPRAPHWLDGEAA